MAFYIERLSKKHLPMVDAFSCVEPDEELQGVKAKKRRRIQNHSRNVENFLKSEALIEQERSMNTTHVLIDKEKNRIAAFVSLCNDSIRLEVDERNIFGITHASVPALKIARLAVANEYKHTGKGKLLVYYSALMGIRIRPYSGLSFLTLDCYEHRSSYYEEIGFIKNAIQQSQVSFDSPISMRMHIDTYLEKLADELKKKQNEPQQSVL